MPETNVHATALLLGDRGLMVTGPSGSGKTTLALTLIRQAVSAGRFARLIADDQLFVHARQGRIIAVCPETIAGLAEVHGLGPWPLSHLRSAVINLVVRLVLPGDAPRLFDPLSETIVGVALPRLDLQARNTAVSSLAVTAWLKALPFR